MLPVSSCAQYHAVPEGVRLTKQSPSVHQSRQGLMTMIEDLDKTPSSSTLMFARLNYMHNLSTLFNSFLYRNEIA